MLVTAAVGGGKTNALVALAEALLKAGHSVSGIVAPRQLAAGLTVGYDVCDLSTGQQAPLARLQPPGTRVGRYYLRPEGLELAAQAIRSGLARAEVVILDEVGPAELGGQGHAAALEELLSGPALPVLAVRSSLLQPVAVAFDLQPAPVYWVGVPGPPTTREQTNPSFSAPG